MKFKIIISLILAVVMLVTLATPALAGRPAKGYLTPYADEVPPGAFGKYAFQATHDNYLKVTVVLRGAQPNTIYWLQLWYGNETPYSDGNSWAYQAVMTNERGSLRYSQILDEVWGGTQYFQLQVMAFPYNYLDDTAYMSGIETFTFN